MKILYVSSLVLRKASSASIRNISLIRALIDEGHQVDVLTVKYPNHLEDDYLKSLISSKAKIIQTELPILNKYLNTKNEDTNKPKSYSFFRSNKFYDAIKNIAKALYFFPDTDKEWLKQQKKSMPDTVYDILITSSDTKTSHFIGEYINRHNLCKKWYQIWGDPWKDDINLHPLSKYRAGFKEASLLLKANLVFYVSAATTHLMKKKFGKIVDKIRLLGRSYLTEIIGRPLGNEEEWVFTYTGSINSNRNISALVQCIERYNDMADNQLKGAKKIRLDIWGHLDNELSIELSSKQNIHVKGTVDTSKIMNIYANSDILVFSDNGTNSSQIPGKLFDYYGTDRPILALVSDLNSKVAQIIISEKRCIVQENNIKKINFDFLSDIGPRDILEQYSGRSVVKRLMEDKI